MSLSRVFELLFAASVIVAAAAFALAFLERISVRVLLALAACVGIAAVAGWVAVALRPSDALAVSAAGLSLATLGIVGAAALRRIAAQSRAFDEQLERAKAEIAAVSEEEAARRAQELEHALSRARADSISALLDEERRLADARRANFTERERHAEAAMAERLAAVQSRVAERVASWTRDLERAQDRLDGQVQQVSARQEQLIAAAEKRLAEEMQRLEVLGDEQRQLVARLRTELMQAARDAVSEAQAELDAHALERRRALTEVEERLRLREKELGDRIEREAVEATRRIAGTLQDVERRQVEQLERIVARAAERYSDAANQQFEEAAKTAREQAAKRLGRELDRAVEMFARDSQSALAERLAEVGDAGARRLEARLNTIAENLERQREEFLQTLEQRLDEAERDLRERTRAAIADSDAQRDALERRLAELQRRIDAALGETERRLAPLRQE